MDYTLNASQAKAADSLSSFIKTSGKYVGTITRAQALVSKKGTLGIGLSFRSSDGSTAEYLDQWTHDRDGKELPSFKVVSAILACLKLRGIKAGEITFDRWNNEIKKREVVKEEGYPELMGKRIGLLLRQELHTNDETGADVERLAISGVFQHDTELTASEVLDQKTKPEQLSKMVEALMARPINDRRKPRSNQTLHEIKRGTNAPAGGGFDDMGDDIPF